MRDGAPRRVTRRDLRREATKASVIEAARTVFLERGYDGATIKAIADAAGVSPGTVLNAAPSKASLLIEILRDEYQAIADAADRLDAALSGHVVDRLTALLQISFEAHARHPELFAAAVGHSWLWTDPAYGESFDQMDVAWEPVRRALQRGVEEGQVRPDLDLALATRLLQDCYLGAVRRSQHDGFDRHGASQLMAARLRLVFDGMRAG